MSLRSSSSDKGLVGIVVSVDKLIPSYLSFGKNVFIIGICGMGDWEKQLLVELFITSSLVNLKVLALLQMLGNLQKTMVCLNYKSFCSLKF